MEAIPGHKPHLRMKTIITATEASRRMGDILRRVKNKGESFLLTKNNQPIAELRPVERSRRATWGEVVAAVNLLLVDPGFVEDLERVNRADRIPENPWD